MSPEDSRIPPGRPRIAALDVVRGFALCGILLVNVQPIANVGGVVVSGGPADLTDGHTWLGLLAEQRFFPIFSLLFGIGFSLLLTSAAGRTARPRALLARRLAVLLGIGLVHLLGLWLGDILSSYAVIGLVVLLPSSWLPRWAVAGLAAVFLATSLVTGESRFTVVAGLFLLGSALVRYGVVDRMERSTRGPALLALLFAVAAVPVLAWQVSTQADGPSWSGRFAMALGGLLVAGLYVCGLLALLRTRLRPVLLAVFAPLGRMALTNYLTATVLVLVVAGVLGGPAHTWSMTRVVAIAGSILAVQWLWSALWLRHHRYGPLEWLWRWATWLRRPPLRVGAGR
ncbi:DUF418 domain-containing protein [Goodfellowiella coeruleoviolacea]|uniref:Membrane protein YeiB n=1 Tax=Goodfellowiella coeruleoviolacea TaxID=334858 RepID=A0AAE3GFQ8_9PSEU|nr:DUF418 domain-containing protein [Goodfellowiella coeruleoviolacea]MCP2166878.1 putative membrane protein YeiB [Goodfellowiella coeruleoviolacea]